MTLTDLGLLEETQTCGSDYDRYGNFRFTHPDAAIVKRVLSVGNFNADLNFGFVAFDHIGQAAVVLFICLPREGWTDIMYMLQDAGYGASAAIYFITFVVIGSFFILNLALAVIWENFSDASVQEAEERKIRKEISLTARKLAQEFDIPPQSRFRTFVRSIVQHWVFNMMRVTLILVNTVMLSLDQYPIDHELSGVVDTLNFALTIAFIFESVLKIVGLGWKQWAFDRYNVFDALLIALALIEIGLSPPAFLLPSRGVTESTVSSFTGLRSFRIFTLFKLARSWPSLQKLLLTILSTIQEIGNFSVLLLLFMYVYALVGMQMFGNQFRFDAEGFPVPLSKEAAYIPRSNFDTILWSMVTIFQILTGENWNEVFLNGWRSTGWASALYFLSLVICGNFIILNLFLAILLSNFEDQDANGPIFMLEKEELRRKSRVVPVRTASMTVSVNERRNTRESSRVSSKRQRTNGRRRSSIVRQPIDDDDSLNSTTSKTKLMLPLGSTQRLTSTTMSDLGSNRKNDKPPQRPSGRSLFLFGPYNPIRTNAWAIVHHPYFDRIVLVLIAASTISVALDNPLNSPDSSFVDTLGWVDFTLTIFFVTEVVLKVIAQGFYFNSNAYLRNNWNMMDFVITAIAVPSLQGSATPKVLNSLRTFRALRPLRLINRNPGLKLVVSSLFASIPQMVNVLMVCLLLLTIFSIIAVNNLKGRLYSCNGDAFDALLAEQQVLVTYPRLWSNLTLGEQQWFNASTSVIYGDMTASNLTSRQLCGFLNATWGKTIPQSFDNVLLGLRTFFEISTTEGWVTLMLASVDATAIDMQPIPNYREGWTLFFIAFIFLGSFFIIQLFIGVVIENFNKMKEKLDGTYMLSGSQREWLMISEAIFNMRPQRKQRMPRDRIRRWCFRHAKSNFLETFAMGCIILNTFMMGLSYFGEEDLYQAAIDNSNYFFTVVFTLEAAIKVIGLGRYYWKDTWNIFDFVIVVGSCFGIVYTWAGGYAVGTQASTIRSVRVARLIKLIQTAPSLRQLVNTLIITLPSLVSVGGFLFLVFFIYAAMGVQLFAKVKFGELVTPHANFQTIDRAMITLVRGLVLARGVPIAVLTLGFIWCVCCWQFRCATGERWNDLMHELASSTNCVSDPPFDAHMCGFANFDGCLPLNGCGSQIAFAYFCSFTMLVTFVLLNIVIAVILEGFANEKDRASGVLLPQHVRGNRVALDATGNCLTDVAATAVL
jgi:voltage-dependent calcium channel L type alpha-1D